MFTRLSFLVSFLCSPFPTAMAQSCHMKSTTNKFALDLHGALIKQDVFDAEDNLFYSPASISVALAMTYLGARGNTEKQMSSTFHLNEIPKEKLEHEFRLFLQAINAANSAGNEILMANRLFAQMGFDILEEFKRASSEAFGANVALVDYAKNATGAREEVNAWVENKTKNKIKDLIPEGMFSPDTRLTLVNAIYFKGSWMKQFNANFTNTGPFSITPTKEIQVPLMYQSAKFRYAENAALQCQMLELPYAGEKMSMIILLPNEVDGLSKLEAALTFGNLDQAITKLKKSHPEKVEVTLPKFKLTQQFSLAKILGQMGASDLFSSTKADLSGITSKEQLYVSEVVHKAFVDVNEEGTEAAAATAVGIMTMSMPLNPVFYANHPFLFLIHHNETGVVLFLGRLAKPDENK